MATTDREQMRGKEQKMSIEISTYEYERAHGKQPRGRGGWAFCPQQNYKANNYLDFVKWFNGTYTEAKRQAVAHFSKQVGTNVVVVCS